MCLVAQVVGAPVQCSEGCEQHNLAISLSVVSVPDHILDTFKFSKYLGLALDPASTLYPQNIRNIRHIQNIFEL